MLSPSAVLNVISRNISTSTPVGQIIKLSRLRVVDNSEIGKLAMMEGKPPRCIHVYNKYGVGYIGETKTNDRRMFLQNHTCLNIALRIIQEIEF